MHTHTCNYTSRATTFAVFRLLTTGVAAVIYQTVPQLGGKAGRGGRLEIKIEFNSLCNVQTVGQHINRHENDDGCRDSGSDDERCVNTVDEY